MTIWRFQEFLLKKKSFKPSFFKSGICITGNFAQEMLKSSLKETFTADEMNGMMLKNEYDSGAYVLLHAILV
jgi:hypothetical protein